MYIALLYCFHLFVEKIHFEKYHSWKMSVILLGHTDRKSNSIAWTVNAISNKYSISNCILLRVVNDESFNKGLFMAVFFWCFSHYLLATLRPYIIIWQSRQHRHLMLIDLQVTRSTIQLSISGIQTYLNQQGHCSTWNCKQRWRRQITERWKWYLTKPSKGNDKKADLNSVGESMSRQKYGRHRRTRQQTSGRRW